MFLWATFNSLLQYGREEGRLWIRGYQALTFREFCKTFIPLPNSSVRSVQNSYPYPGLGYAFVKIPVGVSWVLYDIMPYPTERTRTLRNIALTFCIPGVLPVPVKGCEFCSTLYPFPTDFLNSLQNHTLPHRFCDYYKTFIPLPDSSVRFFIKSHILQNVPVPYRT